MEDGNNIEDWYKDELSKFEVTPDSNGWDAISNQLDEASMGEITEENVDSWYVKELEKYESTPDKDVWNKLSAKLDVNNVWEKLLLSLNRYERLIWWRNFAIQATAIALLFLGSYYTYNNYNGSVSEAELVEKTNNTNDDKLFDSGNNIVSNAKNKLGNQSKNVVAKNSIGSKEILNNNNSITNNSNVKSTPVFTDLFKRESVTKSSIDDKTDKANQEILLASNKKYFGKITSKTVQQLSAHQSNRSVITREKERHKLNVRTLEMKEFLVKKEQNKIIFNNKRFSAHFVFGMYARRVYFGLNAGLKYQTIFMGDRKDEYLAQFDKKQLLDFGSSVGGTVGFIVSDNFNIESNINFLSTNGVKQRFTLDGVSFDEEINLNYSTVSVLFKKMNHKSTFDNKKYSTNFIGGIYAGVLNVAESNSQNNKTNVVNQFNKLDLGIVLGIEQDRYLTKELVITPGVRINQGILNSSSLSEGFVNSSRNFSVEFNVGIKYIFLKKG